MQLSGFVVIIGVLCCYGCKRTCDTTCLNNGTCDNGLCVCTDGHWGVACEKDSCLTCLNRYVDIYIDEYLNKLDTLTIGFCGDCVTPGMVDTAHTWAKQKALQLTCIDTTTTPNQINLSSIIRNRSYDPVSDSFSIEEKNNYIALGAWMDFNPVASPGKIALPACK